MPLKYNTKTRKFKKSAPKKTSKPSTLVSKVARPINALANVTTYHNRLMKTLFDNIRFQFRLINEEEVGVGKQLLMYNTSTAATKFMPLHVYDLTMINTDNQTANPGKALFTNALGTPFFFNITEQLKFAGASSGQEWNTNTGFNKLFMDHVNLRLEIFGRKQYKTTWKVSLVQLLDEELIPNLTISTDNQRHNAFWSALNRPFITHSMLPQDARTMADLKGRYRVIWSKTYRISEQSADFDEVPRKIVKIFRKENKVKVYNENQYSTFNNNDNPNVVSEYDGITVDGGKTTSECRVKQRLFFIIQANCTRDFNSTTGVDGTDGGDRTDSTPSYNLYYETKYTTPNIAQQ